jgi:hypothetical protein
MCFNTAKVRPGQKVGHNIGFILRNPGSPINLFSEAS